MAQRLRIVSIPHVGSLPHLEPDAEKAVRRLELESSLKFVPFPGKRVAVGHSPPLRIIIPVRVYPHAVLEFEIETPHLQIVGR